MSVEDEAKVLEQFVIHQAKLGHTVEACEHFGGPLSSELHELHANNYVPGGPSGGGGGTPTFETIEVDSTVRMRAAIPVQNINTNGPLNITSTSAGAWTASTTAISYTGTPTEVLVVVNLAQGIASNVNLQRIAPVLTVLKNGTEIGRSATGYIRDGNGHEQSSNNLTCLDENPGVDPVYTFVKEADAGAGAVPTVGTSSVTVRATTTRNVSVVTAIA